MSAHSSEEQKAAQSSNVNATSVVTTVWIGLPARFAPVARACAWQPVSQ